MAAEQKASPEELFRFGLEGVIELATKLAPYCNTTDDLVGMCRLALENDGQFRLLMNAAGVQAVRRPGIVG